VIGLQLEIRINIRINQAPIRGNTVLFSDAQLVNVLFEFWGAGLESTATTLRWAMILLVAHRDVQTKLQQEIDAVIGRDRSPTMDDKMKMPFATATLLELQR
jgi:cytochrome P450